MLQWFKKISRRAQDAASPRSANPPTTSRGDISSSTGQPLNDRDYEFLFNQLLEGISHGWQPARILRFFDSLAERGTIAQWSEWLQRYGAKILASSVAHTTLARRLVRLGELTCELPELQQFGETAAGIGRLLLARERSSEAEETPGGRSIAATPFTPSAIVDPPEAASPADITTEPLPAEFQQPEAIAPVSVPSEEKTDPEQKKQAEVTEEAYPTPESPAPESPAPESPAPESPIASVPQENPPTAAETLAALSLSLPTQTLDGQQTITLDELMVRLQADETLVHQVAQRLGLDTEDPQVIIEELVRQINQRSVAAAEPTVSLPVAESEESLQLAAHGDAERAFNLGVQQYEAGDYEAAIAFWEQAIELKPDYYQAWGNRGLGLKHLKQYEAALTSYEQAIAIAPDFYKAWYNRGLVLDELQQYEEAIAAYDQVLTIRSDFHKAWYSRGASLENLDELPEAIAAYDQAIAAKADFYKAWLSRGNCYRHQAQYDLALTDYAQALILKPDNPDILSQQAAALQAVGRSAEAVDCYDQALILQPENPDLLRGRGEVWTALGQVDRALADYEQILAIEPELDSIHFLKAQLLHELGWEQAATEIYQTLLDRSDPDQINAEPHNFEPELWQWRGKLRYQQRDFEGALTDYDQALQQQTKVPELWHDRGRALLALDRTEEAIASFDRALQLAPEQWQIWCDRAQAAAQSPQADLLLSALSAIAQQDERLNQRGLDGQQATLDVALNAIDPEQQPEAWAQLQRQLGNIHYQLGLQAPEGHRNVLWQQAQQHYHLAQKQLDSQTFPLAYLTLLTAKMQLELSQDKPQQASATYEQAQQIWVAHENRSAMPHPEQQALVQQMSLLHQLQVEVHLQRGEFIPALEWSEWGRNLSLAALWEEVNRPEIRSSWPTLQKMLDERTAIVYWHLSPLALTTFLITSDVAEPIVLGRVPNVVLNLVLSPALRARVELAKQDSQASLDLLLELLGLDEQAEQPSDLPSTLSPSSELNSNLRPQQRREQLQTWLEQWQPLTTPTEFWLTQLPEQLAELSQLLQIETIASLLQPKGIKHLILLPHQGLHRAPLAALFPDTFTATVLPSLQFAQLPTRSSVNRRSLDDDPWFKPQPTEELTPGSDAVVASAISSKRENSDLAMLVWPESSPMVTGWELELLQETVAELAIADRPTESSQPPLSPILSTQYAYVHWLPPSLINSKTPSQSRLQSVDECPLLTVAELTTPDLTHCLLWSFDQPEHHSMRHPQPTPDEVSITTPLLSWGVNAILKPLWSVEPLVHQLFVVQFYQYLAQGDTVYTAHRRTQYWLKTITIADLLAWYQAQASSLEARSPIAIAELEALIQAMENEVSSTQPPDVSPYAHPYYWAGYVIIGYPPLGA